MEEKRKTVGQQISEHNAKNIDLEDHVREYSNAMQEMILKELHGTAKEALTKEAYKGRDIYLVLVKNVDHLLKQPIFKYIARTTCPAPVYKQDVFKYHHKTGVLEFLWCIPSKERYHHILQNRKTYLDNHETRNLAYFVLSMESGRLLEWAKKENGELQDAVIKVEEARS